MSLKRCGIDEVPEMTVQVAQAAFPQGNVYMQMRDEVGTLYEDDNFARLYPTRGQPGLAPWRLALVTVMQFAENLTDRQAANAVRGRIDWKYALGLELTDAGFHYSVLSEFRARLVEGDAVTQLLDVMLGRFAAQGLLKTRGRQRTDSTHVVAAVHSLTRLEVVHETLRYSLNRVAQVAPSWLKDQVSPEWYERYSDRLDDRRYPKTKTEQIELAEVIGRDGYHLWYAIQSEKTPGDVHELSAVEVLRQVWLQAFYVKGGIVRWRDNDNIPPAARMISSPYDLEARFSTKRSVTWVGYKVHLTETCDDDQPHLITHVETTPATTQDITVVETIHADLAAHERLPEQHIVDAAYVEADELITSREQYNIDLLGPTRPDTSWQARAAQGFDLAHFTIDWDAQHVICPQGHTSISWLSFTDGRGHASISARFSLPTCRACACRPQCTRAKRDGRSLTFPNQQRYEALLAARHRQTTETFSKEYARRAGIEGTISQAAYALRGRRARYVGLAKTHLQHVATAAAINLGRIFAWRQGQQRAPTRISSFAALAVA